MPRDWPTRWQALPAAITGLRRLAQLSDPLALRDDELPAAQLHPVPTLVFCLQGVVRIRGRRRQIDLNAGEALLIAPGTRHQHESLRAGSLCFQLGFKNDCCDVAFTDAGSRQEAHLPLADLQARLGRLAARAEAPEAALSQLREMLRQLPLTPPPLQAPPPSAVEQMILHLWRSFDQADQPQSIAETARASGLARSQAYALFTAYYGHGLARAREDLRLQLAAHLLQAGLRVAAVAARCGFSERRALTRVWRRRFGCPPRVWLQESSTSGEASSSPITKTLKDRPRNGDPQGLLSERGSC